MGLHFSMSDEISHLGASVVRAFFRIAGVIPKAIIKLYKKVS